MVHNGFCNDETNIAVCNFDGGDCCLSTVNKEHCSDCSCHHQQTCLAGVHPLLGGDGHCHDELNNLDCNYDGGDCCLSPVNTEYCSDCSCHLQQTCFAGVHPFVGDGYCDDELNTADCNYDSRDCCVNVNSAYCSECSCLELQSGFIKSPGFPGGYDSYLNLTWLIQAPLGQLIEINFLYFDLDYLPFCE